MSVEVLLVRHAETDWNRAGRFQGHRDVDLNARGRAWAAARRLPRRFATHRRFTSPLMRARRTAACLAPGAWRPDPRLMEMDWGRWTGETWQSLEDRLGAALDDRRAAGLDFRPPGGESPRELQVRALEWLRECAGDAPGTVAVTHKGTIRALLGVAFDWDLAGRMPVKLDWSAGQLFSYDRASDALALAEPDIALASAGNPEDSHGR